MPQINSIAIAIHAAGIADALACLKADNAEANARFERISEECGGHVGIMQQVVDAAGYMERFRIAHGTSATWGGELPYVYEVWDAVAETIWLRLEEEPLDQLVQSTIQSIINMEAAR